MKKGRLNKKRLFLVVFIFVLFIFLISRLFIGIKGYIVSRHQVEPPVKTQEEIEREKNRVINVIIDPAKGGINEGLSTPDGSMKEKDINLDIAKRIKADLKKHEDVNVWLTREYDEDIDTKERISSIKKHKGDILVSIRLNARGKSNEASGMDTYYSDLGSTRRIADEEKASIRPKKEKNDKESDITDISDYKSEKDSNRENIEERNKLSKELAESIQSTTLSFIEFKDRGVSKKNFDILMYTDMPSAIVQCGFISNDADGEKLQNEDSRQEIADGISDGILNYIDGNRDGILKDRINYR